MSNTFSISYISIIVDFGDSDVQELITHFEPMQLTSGVKVGEVLDEWTVLKSRLYQHPGFYKTSPGLRLTGSLAKSAQTDRMRFTSSFAIPASTADCERGFRAMKLVKSDWRASFKAQTLSDLLTLQLSSASIADFDPTTDIKLWHVGGLRSQRPIFMEQRDKQRRDDSDDKSYDDI